LLTTDRLLLAETTGLVEGIPTTVPKTVYRYMVRGGIDVPAGQYQDTAYVVAHSFLYAASITAGTVLWRFPVGSPVLYRPVAQDDHVYVSSARTGIIAVIRVDRQNMLAGEELWRSPGAERFLAANPKFVYAHDPSGRLVIVDRARGTQLAVHDALRDFVIPVPNEWNDRLFLAANNGRIICLHDRDYASPVVMKKVPARIVPGAKPAGQ
jgi:outer membrane protein assembly factor BamB